MILVFTTESGDFSHNEIINWLHFYNAPYRIMTGEEVLKGGVNLSIENGGIIYDGINLTKEVSCVYYRRWIYPENLSLTRDGVLNKDLIQNLFYESIEIKNFLQYGLKDAVWIPNPESISVNKLAILEEARSCGLLVPKYMVTTQKSDLEMFMKGCNRSVITKAIGNYTDSRTQDNILVKSLYTKSVTEEMVALLPSSFTSTLFQERIKKVLN